MARRALRRTRFSAPRIRYRTRTVRAAGRGMSKAARLAREEKHTIYAVGAAAAIGYAEANDIDVPHWAPLGVAGTLGAAAFLYGRYANSKIARHLATGALSIAAYKITSGAEGGTSGDYIEGEIPALEEAYDEPPADDDE